MSIAEMQACLARLYVDEAFLGWFKLEPEAALDQYSLTVEEQSAIRGINRQQLTMFATSLKSKKKGRFSSTYPLSFQAMPKAMDLYTHRYYQVRGISQGDGQLDLVLDFGRFVEETLAGDGEVPFYARDLVRYERLLSACKLSPRRPAAERDGGGSPEVPAARPAVPEYVLCGRFACDIEEVCRLLRRDEPVTSVQQREFHIAFCPKPAWGRARTFQLTGPTRQLLELCDGRRTVGQLVEVLRRTYGEVVETSVPAMISKLFGLALLESRRDDAEPA